MVEDYDTWVVSQEVLLGSTPRCFDDELGTRRTHPIVSTPVYVYSVSFYSVLRLATQCVVEGDVPFVSLRRRTSRPVRT